MTVKELITKLSEFDPNSHVYVKTDDFYGGVSEITYAYFDNDMTLEGWQRTKVEGVYLEVY